MHFLYSCLFTLLLPVLFLRLYWRGIKVSGFRQRWSERLAYYHQPHAQQVLWFHAVSVGEVESLFPLLKQLLSHYPQQRLLVTTMTPSGSARVLDVLGQQVEHVYLPYDIPFLWQRFLKHFQPKLAVMAETEVWPNLFALCAKRQLPLIIINARLSENALNSYQKLPSLFKPALQNLSFIAAQTQADADRFIALGTDSNKVKVFGNIKFDSPIDSKHIEQAQALRSQIFAKRFVWIIASTHKNEENIFFQLYAQLKAQIPELLLLLVPRNIERFDEVKKLAQKQQLQVVMRTSGQVCDTNTDIYIADTMGELKMLYACADVAFVGGSMVPVGGHNVLEPAAVGIPVMFGPYMSNFTAIANGLLNANAALQCSDAYQLSAALLRLYREPDYRRQLGAQAQTFVQQNQGVVAKIIDLLEQFLQN